MIPIMIAPGIKISTSLFSFFVPTSPNLRVEVFHPEKFPVYIELKIVRTKLPTEQEKNTFQIMENFQKVFGYDIS
jgi:hypothetical protein